MRHFRQLRDRDGLRKTVDDKVGGIGFEDQLRTLLIHGLLVISGMRLVRAADLNHLGAALIHDLRNAERAADFHQFPAGHRNLFPFGQGVQHQENGSRVVVDHHGGFRPCEFAEELFHMRIAASALSVFQVILQIAVAFAEFRNVFRGRFSQRGAAEVCVQHYTRCIDDPFQVVEMPCFKPGQHSILNFLRGRDRIDPAVQRLFSQVIQAGLDGRLHEGIGYLFLHCFDCRPGQDQICFRNLPEQF